MFPTRRQWRNWSLPSKLTAVSAYLTIISVMASLGAFSIGLFNGGPWTEARLGSDVSSSKIADQLVGPSDQQLSISAEMICPPRDVCRDKEFFLPKLILVKENASIYGEPDMSAYAEGVTLRPFKPYFVLSTRRTETSARWLKVGTSPSNALGWIRAKSSLQYDSRLSLRLLGRESRAIAIFPTAASARRHLATYDEDDNEKVVRIPSALAAKISEISFLPALAYEETFTESGDDVRLIQTEFNGLATRLLSISCTDCDYWLTDLDAEGGRNIEPVILITREEIDTYVSTARNLMARLIQLEMDESNFFDALQELFFFVTQFSSTNGANHNVFDRDLIVSWFEELPYRSFLSKITQEDFENMSVSQRMNIMEEVQSKIEILEALNFENLNTGAPDKFAVFMIGLSNFI